MKENDICPHCNEGTVVLVKGTDPYTTDHYQCTLCDSTFNKE